MAYCASRAAYRASGRRPHEPFQLSGPLLRRRQPAPLLLDVAVLLVDLGLLDGADERRPVSLGVVGYGVERVGNKGKDYLLRDTVLGGAEGSHGDFAVLGASVL